MATTASILIFVDRPLAISIAAKLVGVTQAIARGNTAAGGINWLISANASTENSSEEVKDIRELLPEDVVYVLFPMIKNRYDGVDDIRKHLTTSASDPLVPGTAVSVKGRMTFPGLELPPDYTPFSDTTLDLHTVIFHGERCLVAQLETAGYKIPVYLPNDSKYQVVYCNNEPVEVTGIVRWTPPYSAGGASALNLAIRAAALWLQ